MPAACEMPYGREGIYFISLSAQAENFTMIADHYFTSGGYFTSHSVFLLYNQSNLSVIGFTQRTDKLEFAEGSAPRTTLSFKNQRAGFSGNLHRNFGLFIVIHS